MSAKIFHLDLHPQVERLDDGSRKIITPWRYRDSILGTVIVPVGFVTDYSSVPHRLSWLMPPWWKIDLAGILHDYLYRERAFTAARRKRADVAWATVAAAQGNSSYSVSKGYYGLRAFGWTSYGERNPHVKEAA